MFNTLRNPLLFPFADVLFHEIIIRLSFFIYGEQYFFAVDSQIVDFSVEAVFLL